MKSQKPDSFLIGHARRMRNCRQRQKENNPELYKNKVNNQRREYRLYPRFNVLTENQTLRRIDSVIKTRLKNRQRQRRYRLNQRAEQKSLRLDKDRIYQLLKRQKQQLQRSDRNNLIDAQILSDVANSVTNYEIMNSTTYVLFSHDS
ncbi:MAG: hypothetical protein IPG85_07680 [Bacteroidetes bacterium]|nr:hypothetical protein [Bacteroidota bacterium]